MVVSLVDNDLRSEVLWRSAHGPCLVVDALCKAKISDTDVASVVDEHVLRLKVAEDDIEVVNVFEGNHCLSSKEESLLLREAALFLLLDVGEHLSSVHELKAEVEVLRVLKVVEQLHDELAIHAEENILLVDGVLNLSGLDHTLF